MKREIEVLSIKPELIIKSALQEFNLEWNRKDFTEISGTSGLLLILSCSAGKFAIKLRSKEHSDIKNVKFEHKLLHLLNNAGVPVAMPLKSISGKTWSTLKERIIEVSPWLDGNSFEFGKQKQLISTGRNLALFHSATSKIAGRKAKIKEDDPNFLLQELNKYTDNLIISTPQKKMLKDIKQELSCLRKIITSHDYLNLPKTVIHGDFHPGNLKYKKNKLAGIFDFDWANYQEKIRDIGDGLMFFASNRANFNAEDIWQLTQGFDFDNHAIQFFLNGYESLGTIQNEEKAMLKYVMSARWLQMRIRGMRKVPIVKRIEFLDRGDLMTTLTKIYNLILS